MELRQVKYFLKVAELKSFTKASEELHISQPALSNAVRSLEKEIGAKLFDRFGNRIELNANGIYFREHVVPAVMALNAAKRYTADRGKRRNNIVNCAIGAPLGHIGKLTAELRRDFPEISLRIGVPSAEMFKGKNIDVSFFCSFEEKKETAHRRAIFQEEVLLVLPSDHRLKDAKTINMSDLTDEPFVMSDKSELTSNIIRECRNRGFDPQTTMQAELWFDALCMVEAGLGCAFAGSFTWLAGLEHNVVVRRVCDVELKRTLYAETPVIMKPSEATEGFINFVSDYAREHAARTN